MAEVLKLSIIFGGSENDPKPQLNKRQFETVLRDYLHTKSVNEAINLTISCCYPGINTKKFNVHIDRFETPLDLEMGNKRMVFSVTPIVEMQGEMGIQFLLKRIQIFLIEKLKYRSLIYATLYYK